MSLPNQKSITSFFQAPKYPRSPESQVEILNNRFSKSTRTSAPSLSDMELNDFEIDNLDIDNEVELDKLLSIEENTDFSPLESINTTSLTQKPNSRVFYWKDEYTTLFPWLQYNATTGIACCSYSSCKMYKFSF